MRSTVLQPRLVLGMALLALVRRPASSLLAVGVLALGLAAPATFFSFLVGASRPLPVPEGDRIVRVDVIQPSRDGRDLPVLEADLPQLTGSRTLAAVGGFRTFAGTLVDGELAATRVSGAELTPEVLRLLGVRPLLGRIPGGSDPEPALVLAHDLWQEVYRGDPEVLGRVVNLGGDRVPVVAVMPEGFAFPFRQNAWVVRGVEPGGREALELVARLADGADAVSAREEVALRWSRGDATREEDRVGGVVQVRRFTEGRGEGGEAVAFAGLVLVALCLLVIACANVANLLLVRTTERIRALAIQSALGAGRAQISAQLLAESAFLAALGGIVGLGLAYGAVAAVQGTLAAEHFGYHWMRLAVDGPVVAFTAALVLGAALLAGFLPVLRVLQIDVQSVLKEEGRPRIGRRRGGWGRAFVTGQLALSCGALVAAGLTGTALVGSRDFGAGIPAEQILLASVGVGRTSARGRDIEVREVVDAVASTPGARAVAMAVGAPGYREPGSPLRVDGVGPPFGAPASILWNAVTPGFFDVLDLDQRAGRSLAWQDDAEAPPVAVVNESFVRRFSADRPVLGRRVQLAGADSAAWFTVVGVVEDAGLGGGERAREDRVYLSALQVPTAQLLVLARTGNDAGSLAGAVRRAVAGVDPAVAVWDVRTLADAHAYMIRVPRTIGSLALGGGAAGFLVAAVGLYGLLAFRVRQRRGELGIRLAVGADGLRLAQAVLGWAMRLLAPAVAAGLALAWLASPILSVALLGLDPRDPAVYAAVGVAFLLVGLLAALGPAVRAAGVDPASTLRRD